MIELSSLYEGVHLKSEELADLVGDLQKFLLGLDYTIRVDEEFGPKTKAVVKLYQKSRGLKGDGWVGTATWGALLSDGFRPKSYEPDRKGDESLSYQRGDWPPRPAGSHSPNGLGLFGAGFQYTPKPLPSMPEYVIPDSSWVRDNIRKVNIPQLMGVPGAPSDGNILFNRRLLIQLQTLFQIWDVLYPGEVLSFAGSWVPRFVRGRKDVLSNHSFGSAFDINAAWNGYRKEPALVGRKGSVRRLVMPAYELGFYWGGWYNDGMHFEAYKELSLEEIALKKEELLS